VLKQFFTWLRRLFGGAPPPAPEPRALAAGGSASSAEAKETTPAAPAATGKPAKADKKADKKADRKADKAAPTTLKPKQRRLALRDERLLPKAPRGYQWNAPKPPAVIAVAEAKRLFADTLRTSSKDLRTLATDVAQLERYGLPIWKTEADVAAALDISVGALRHFSIHRPRERVEHYVTYAIPKRRGGHRTIHAPKARLKKILRRLQTELVSKLPVSEHAHGFVTGRSVKTGAELHVGKRVLLRLDLRDFFPTVTSARVRGYLIALGYGYPVAAALAVLATEAPRQRVDVDGTLFFVPVGPRTCVQGAPTSPGLCNSIVYKLDRRIAALAKRAGFAYTRYADDLTLSGDDVDAAHRLRRRIERVIREEGFEVNAAKTRVMTTGGAQRVTGVTVNSVLGLSRAQRRRIRAMVHENDPAQKRHVDGLIAWVEMLNHGQALALKNAPRKPAK
jgi:hypothetical protein